MVLVPFFIINNKLGCCISLEQNNFIHSVKLLTRGYYVKRHLKQYFSYFVVVSLISGGNRKSYPEKIADLPQNTDVNSYQVVSVWLYCNISLVMNLFISRLVEIYSVYRLSLFVYKLTISIWGRGGGRDVWPLDVSHGDEANENDENCRGENIGQPSLYFVFIWNCNLPSFKYVQLENVW